MAELTSIAGGKAEPPFTNDQRVQMRSMAMMHAYNLVIADKVPAHGLLDAASAFYIFISDGLVPTESVDARKDQAMDAVEHRGFDPLPPSEGGVPPRPTNDESFSSKFYLPGNMTNSVRSTHPD